MKLIAYGKTNWGRDFPSALEDPVEVKNYVSAFYYALSPLLKEVSDGDEHIMRACSLLAILPSPAWDAREASGDPHGSQYHETTQLGQQRAGPRYWAGYVATHLLSDWKSNPVICPPQIREGGRSQILQVLPASTHGVQMQSNQCVESYLNQADSSYSNPHSFT